MRLVKNTASQNYHVLVLAGLLFGGITLLIRGYEQSFLILNSYHNPVADVIFPHLTHLGDGGILCGLAALILARRAPWAIVLLVAAVALAGGLTQLLKHTFFHEWPRPVAVFGADAIHGTADGGLRLNSFPSGHATAAMAGATALALQLCARTRYALQLGVLGIAVAYSRVYIGAHFFGDIVAGGMIGYAIAVAIVAPLQKRLKAWFDTSEGRTRTWGWVLTALGAIAFGWQVYQRYGA